MIQRAVAVAHKFFLELVNQAQARTYNQPHLRAADSMLHLTETQNAVHFQQAHPCEALQQHPHGPAPSRHAVMINPAGLSAI